MTQPKQLWSDGILITYPLEGTTKTVGDKTYIWTKRVDDTCEIYEWVEKKPVHDYYIPTDDVYF